MARQIEIIASHSEKIFREQVNEFCKNHNVIQQDFDFPVPLEWKKGASLDYVTNYSDWKAIIVYDDQKRS